MSQRISYYEVAPEGMKIVMDMGKYTKSHLIDRTIRELIKIRVSSMDVPFAYWASLHVYLCGLYCATV